MKYRKKPVVIEARQIPATFDYDETCEILGWINDNGGVAGPIDEGPNVVYIATLEGEMEASLGDWIIRGVRGEFYPCKPDIFEATYERAD